MCNTKNSMILSYNLQDCIIIEIIILMQKIMKLSYELYCLFLLR